MVDVLTLRSAELHSSDEDGVDWWRGVHLDPRDAPSGSEHAATVPTMPGPSKEMGVVGMSKRFGLEQ